MENQSEHVIDNEAEITAEDFLEIVDEEDDYIEDDEYDDVSNIDKFHEDVLRQQRHYQRASFYSKNPLILSEFHASQQIKIQIVSSYGFKIKSSLYFTVESATHKIHEIYWRSHPNPLGCEFKYVKSVEKRIGKKGFFIEFIDYEMQILLDDPSEEVDLVQVLQKQVQENAINGDISYNFKSPVPSVTSSPVPKMKSPAPKVELTNYFHQTISKYDYVTAIKQEQLLQMTKYFQYKEAWLLLSNVAYKIRETLLFDGLNTWIEYVRNENNQRMLNDRRRWKLHTAANQENDLQAWYHSIFHHEVYRLRGPFWYRDAVLPIYRKSYTIVDTGMTALEEAAVAHVLCSPETTYGDVAGHMFVIQAITTEEEYALFQHLVSQGQTIVKYPRMGRPAKKHFRLSFVEGSVYFTWKGKFGNQGINLGEVNTISDGLSTDILRRTGSSSKSDLYASLNCSGRSVDICLDTPTEKQLLKSLLEKIVSKEHGILPNISNEVPDQPDGINPDIDTSWFVLYSAIGEMVISPAIKAHLLHLSLD